ncbi:MAG: hypothetical protein HYS32_03840 [Candidatus Woesearchaeota archaeon]|nr:MAG: hypothetical protein HYS32_03840 [Candidatus Woesearchaeota archaeon]
MISIVLNEVIISGITAIIGATALAYASRARQRLSAGTFKAYVSYFVVCLLLLVWFSIWRIAREVFQLRSITSVYIEYGILVIIYVIFAVTSQKIFTMSREFGFSEKTDLIKKAILEKKLKKRTSQRR